MKITLTKYICAIGVLLLVGVINSCSTYIEKNAQVRSYLKNQRIAPALKLVSNSDYLGKVLQNMHKSILLRAQAKYALSNFSLEEAKKDIARLEAVSVMEQTTSLVTNDEQVSFIGAWYEQLLIYVYKALNYISLNNIEGARVEMLQAQVRLKELYIAHKKVGFVYYLSGLIYEMLDENDAAIISYRQAIKSYKNHVPRVVQGSFIELLSKEKRADELNNLSKKWNIQLPDTSNYTKVVLWLDVGLIESKKSIEINHYSTKLSNNLRIALPAYPSYRNINYKAYVSGSNLNSNFETLANLEEIARRALKDDMPKILAKTVSRIIVKKKLSYSLLVDDLDTPFVDIGKSLFLIWTEKADTRSWDSLPRDILINSIYLPLGEHKLTISLRAHNKVIRNLSLSIKIANKSTKIIAIPMFY